MIPSSFLARVELAHHQQIIGLKKYLCKLSIGRYRGRINFLYMPIDFSTECNVGYAFINFRDQHSAEHFKEKYNQCHTKKCLPGYNSNKVAEVSLAAVQGLQANLDRLKRSPLLPMLKANEGWYMIDTIFSG